MKAKSLHFSKHGSAQPIAAEIGRVYQCVCDQIPPAYPCEGDKVVFIGVEMSGKLPGPVEHFCRDLNPTRAKNVAFYVINGNVSGLDGIKKELEANGVHMVDDVLTLEIKSSLFKKGVPTDADIQKAMEWSKNVIANKLK
ncbi:MAG TPA: hypothetical protein IAA80_00075 [Candidatus Gallacutalibacter pullistercoris]|nr:hypothetical protein [Candidatus Gallacutalibacter pullistercoris]